MMDFSLSEKIEIALIKAYSVQQDRPSREGALVLTKLQEAMFWCLAGGLMPPLYEREVEND